MGSVRPVHSEDLGRMLALLCGLCLEDRWGEEAAGSRYPASRSRPQVAMPSPLAAAEEAEVAGSSRLNQCLILGIQRTLGLLQHRHCLPLLLPILLVVLRCSPHQSPPIYQLCHKSLCLFRLSNPLRFLLFLRRLLRACSKSAINYFSCEFVCFPKQFACCSTFSAAVFCCSPPVSCYGAACYFCPST